MNTLKILFYMGIVGTWFLACFLVLGWTVLGGLFR
jgi:hypothetical protein